MRADRLFSFVNYSSSSKIGDTTIPSSLGTTITGALNNLNNDIGKCAKFVDYDNPIESLYRIDGNKYTATQNCFIVLDMFGVTTTRVFGYIDINNKHVGQIGVVTSDNGDRITCYLRKDDYIQLNKTSGGNLSAYLSVFPLI